MCFVRFVFAFCTVYTDSVARVLGLVSKLEIDINDADICYAFCMVYTDDVARVLGLVSS